MAIVSWFLEASLPDRESIWTCLKYFQNLNKGSFSSTLKISTLKSCFTGKSLDLTFSLRLFHSLKIFLHERLVTRNTVISEPSKT